MCQKGAHAEGRVAVPTGRLHRNPLKCAELKTLTGQKVHHLHGLIRGTRIKPCIRPISTASGGSGPCGLNRQALLLGNASIYRTLRDISQGPSRISRSCLSLVCRGCALCDDAEGSIPARRSSFLHNSVNRSTCEPFELRRPLLAFRSARQRRQLRTDISVYLAHLAKRYDCRVVSESPQRIWLSLWQSHVDKAFRALVEP